MEGAEGPLGAQQNSLAQLLAAWDLPPAAAPQGQEDPALAAGGASPSFFKGVPVTGFSDVQLRRDVDPFGAAPAAAQAGGAAFSHLEASSGHGSDAGGSGQRPASSDGVQKPSKRGRGRARKSGIETAQQRAHRRFYERKKQRMATLEQDAHDKQQEYLELLAINAELRRKHEALERAVAGRDEHMVLVQALGSLAIGGAAAAAAGRLPPPHAPAVPEQQQLQPEAPGSSVPAQLSGKQQPSEQQVLAGMRTQSSPMQSSGHSSWGTTGLTDLGRSTSAPSTAAAAPPAELLPEVEEAGPFGLVQLPQFGEDDDALLQPITPAAKQPHQSQQAQEPQQELPSWLAPLNLPDDPMPSQQQQQQQPGGGEASFGGTGFVLTRSTSVPARTSGFDALMSPDGFAATLAGGGGGGAAALGAPTHSRSFSSTPTAWTSRTGSLLRPAAAAADDSWPGFGAAQQLQQQQQQPQLGGPGGPTNTRPHSWSGVAPGMPGAGTSHAQPPAWQPRPQPQPQLQLQQPMWGPVTTAGPPLVPPQQPQQRMQEGQRTLELPKLDPDLSSFTQQQQQQQQWAAPSQPGMPAWLQGLPQGLPLEQQLMQPPVAFGAAGTPLQPQQQQAQLMQQMQQLGDMAFGGQLLQQHQPGGQPGGAPDDLMLLDDDIMELLERVSQQQSIDMLSPLPSIPSALLTGDSLRAAVPDTAAAAAPAAAPAAPTDAAPGFDPARQLDALQQPQLQQQQLGGGAAAAGAAGLPTTLLEASHQLQARHRAAGFCPPASSPNEMFYVHEMVAWYRAKLVELQGLLPAVDQAVPDVSCGVRLIQVMEEVIDATRKFGARNRIGMWELKLINLETGEFQEASQHHWAHVAARIQLPPQMRESALACYSLYLEYVDKVKAERLEVLRDFAALEAQLLFSSATAAATGYEQQPQEQQQQQQQQQQQTAAAPATLQFRVDGYDEYQALLERLQLSLKREHMVANMLSYSLAQVASHVQMAKGMLACWPYWPDGPSVLAMWAEEEQLLQQQQQQQGGGSGGDAGL